MSPALLWALPGLPLAGFLLLALAGRRLDAGVGRRAVTAVGVGSVGASAVLAAVLAWRFLAAPPPAGEWSHRAWTWMRVGGLEAGFTLQFDALALVMTLVVAGVGFLIHLYAAGYMAEDDGYPRFFAWMNLFVAAMLVLVLSRDLLLLYLGWEGVGLASYLLIGFWYRDPANGRAARKAFLVTRIGDAAMALALFLLVTRLGSLDIPTLLARAPEVWPVGAAPAALAAALLLAGAVGKSAQLPLQTWLPDAMAGPTPVSALIHAATMVTAGVYLVARLHPLFELAPAVLAAVALIGLATLLIAGASALVQGDVKRVLAYSTMSQLGYMFLALGVGAWSAAIFHLFTHAFFKALLFLGAGVLIQACDGEHHLERMGGLARRLPLTFWTFLAGAAALAGLPLVSAGFYSKDAILLSAWAAPGGAWLWAGGLLGALLTALYTGRLVLLAFLAAPGEAAAAAPTRRPGAGMKGSMVVLAVLSLTAGLLETPAGLGGVHLFSGLLEPVLGHGPGHPGGGLGAALQGAAAAAVLLGLLLAWRLWRPGRPAPDEAARLGPGLHRFLLAGWRFDTLWDALLVRPFVGLAAFWRDDPFTLPYHGLAASARAGHRGLARTQSGRLGWYAACLVAGAVLLLGWMVLS